MPESVASDRPAFSFSLICEAAVHEVYFIARFITCFKVVHFTCWVQWPCLKKIIICPKIEIQSTEHPAGQQFWYWSLTWKPMWCKRGSVTVQRSEGSALSLWQEEALFCSFTALPRPGHCTMCLLYMPICVWLGLVSSCYSLKCLLAVKFDSGK